ncbi:alpha/beta hydrolase [uncultured Ferrimonas sp.]|uniref:alpha/beta fold hydrolase n=1 Tax=uncultured Ferrimonas sp. TaxID=432640 RepID=UPI0026314A90|nr:alpha/beta hydrolase [uncultured Ferrimonas sp.]
MFQPVSAHSPYLSLGGRGPAAHFYHANGFPIGVYQPLLRQLLPHFSLTALPMRPTWPDAGKPPQYHGWMLYVDDLIEQIERHHNEPIIGIGHSMGASCTALAAYRRPDLFSQLVLIEPVTVATWQSTLLRYAPNSLKQRHPLVKSTLAKRHHWPTPQQFVHELSRKRPFQHIEADTLEAFADHGVRPTSSGNVELVFDKIWEAANYSEARNIMPVLTDLPVPTVAIRGKPSAFFSDTTWQQWQRNASNVLFKQNQQHGHLMPLENAKATAELIRTGVAELSQRNLVIS